MRDARRKGCGLQQPPGTIQQSDSGSLAPSGRSNPSRGATALPTLLGDSSHSLTPGCNWGSWIRRLPSLPCQESSHWGSLAGSAGPQPAVTPALPEPGPGGSLGTGPGSAFPQGKGHSVLGLAGQCASSVRVSAGRENTRIIEVSTESTDDEADTELHCPRRKILTGSLQLTSSSSCSLFC